MTQHDEGPAQDTESQTQVEAVRRIREVGIGERVEPEFGVDETPGALSPREEGK